MVKAKYLLNASGFFILSEIIPGSAFLLSLNKYINLIIFNKKNEIFKNCIIILYISYCETLLIVVFRWIILNEHL